MTRLRKMMLTALFVGLSLACGCGKDSGSIPEKDKGKDKDDVVKPKVQGMGDLKPGDPIMKPPGS